MWPQSEPMRDSTETSAGTTGGKCSLTAEEELDLELLRPSCLRRAVPAWVEGSPRKTVRDREGATPDNSHSLEHKSAHVAAMHEHLGLPSPMEAAGGPWEVVHEPYEIAVKDEGMMP